MRAWLETSHGFFFGPGLLNRLVTPAPPGNKTLLLSRDSRSSLCGSLSSCAEPSALERDRPNRLVTLGKSLHVSESQFSFLQNGDEENFTPISWVVNN